MGRGRRFGVALALTAAGLAAGCTPVLVPLVPPIPVILPAPAGPADDRCGASALAAALGRPLAEVALPEDRPVRVIRPGDMVTQDFVPARLNLELDAGGRVARLRCG